jgi:hypothetical protein
MAEVLEAMDNQVLPEIRVNGGDSDQVDKRQDNHGPVLRVGHHKLG